jgi:hypothetical protein
MISKLNRNCDSCGEPCSKKYCEKCTSIHNKKVEKEKKIVQAEKAKINKEKSAQKLKNKEVDLESMKGKNVALKPKKVVKSEDELEKEKKKKAAEKALRTKEKAKAKREEKKFTKSILMSVADDVFSLYIRLRDTDSQGFGTCVSSGRIIPWTSSQLGHYIPRGYMEFRYHEKNCHIQSAHDNGRLHGNIPEYRRFIINTYGKEWEEEMFLKSKQPFPVTANFFLEIIKKYLPLIPKLLESKSFDTTYYWKKFKPFMKLYLQN